MGYEKVQMKLVDQVTPTNIKNEQIVGLLRQLNMNPVAFMQDQETYLHEKILPQQREHPIFKAAQKSVLEALEKE